MILNIASIVIAVLSFVLSIYVVSRDRKNKKFDNLLMCRQRILDTFDNKEIFSVEEMIEFFEDNPHSQEAQKHKVRSQSIMQKVEREFEFTCYLVMKDQVDLSDFFEIFKGWLAMRSFVYNRQEFKKRNLPYTWKVIKLCTQKKMLPLAVSPAASSSTSQIR